VANHPWRGAATIGFDGDVYGRHAEVELRLKLRDEKRFASLDGLKAQIDRDVVAARAYVLKESASQG
jgi:riboflavin kinase/FMN adenylyltransferase